MLEEIIKGQRLVENDAYGIFLIKKNSIDLMSKAEDIYIEVYNDYRQKGFVSKEQAEIQAKKEFDSLSDKKLDIEKAEKLIEKYAEYLKSLEVDVDKMATDTELIGKCLERVLDIFTEEELEMISLMDKKKIIEQRYYERSADSRAEEVKVKFILQQTVYKVDGKLYWETIEDFGNDTDGDKVLWLMSEKKLLEMGVPSDFEVFIPLEVVEEKKS